MYNEYCCKYTLKYISNIFVKIYFIMLIIFPTPIAQDYLPYNITVRVPRSLRDPGRKVPSDAAALFIILLQ